MSSIPPSVAALEQDLRSVFGDRLQTLLIYGDRPEASDIEHGHGHTHRRAPGPLHTLAIVGGLSHEDLTRCATFNRRWHDGGLATPLILPEHEFQQSLDIFPLEYGEILAHHSLVTGRNPFDGAIVDDADVRRACEVQAKSHLIHLRQGYMEAGGNADALAILIVNSAAPLAALLKSVARLGRVATADPMAVARHLERQLDTPAGSFADIVKLVGVHEIPADEAQRLLPGYLESAGRLAKFLNDWTAA